MAYSTEAQAGYRISGFLFNAVSSCKGRIRALIEKIVDREMLMADTNNVPISRPVNVLDARVTIDFLDQAGGLSHTTAAANIEIDFTEAGTGGAGSPSVIVGAMDPCTIRHNWGRNQGGFGIQQEFELEGALTYTPTA